MPVTEQTAKKHAARLRALPMSGDDDDATGRRREVGQALIRAAADDDHVGRIVEALLRKCRWYPTPSEVWEAADVIEPQGLAEAVKAPASGCAACGGTGFRIVVMRGVEAAEVCGCRRAQQSRNA